MRAASNPVRLGKYSLGKIFFTICKYVLLIFAAFCALVPLVSCVITAFKTKAEYNNTNVMTLPESWLYFDNFVTAWKQAHMGKAFLNRFLVLLFVLLGSTLFSAMLAYVLNRFQFRGNKLIRNLFMISTLIPGIATQVTIYQIMYTLGLVNTLYGYIILMLGTDVISIYIFLQYFDKGVSTYNEYYMANLYLQDKKAFPVVSTSLFTFTGPMGSQYNYICAGVLITVIPMLILFICCQKQIYSGMAQGAVKE